MYHKKLLGILLVFILLMPPMYSLTIKSGEGNQEIDSRIMAQLGQLEEQGKSTPKANVLEGSGGHETIYYERSSSEPVQIQKIVLPGNKKKYLRDDVLRICVEVKGYADINAVTIQEFISDDLVIINSSDYGYIIDNLKYLPIFRDYLYAGIPQNFIKNYSNTKKFKIDMLDGTNTFLLNHNIDEGNITGNERANLINFLSKYIDINSDEEINITRENKDIVFIKIDDLNSYIEVDQKNRTALLRNNNMTHQLCIGRESALQKNAIKVSNLDNNFNIYVPELKSKERLFYWYCVKPKRESVLNTITTIRIQDSRFKNYPDTDYPLDVEIVHPSYKVTATFDRLTLFTTQKLFLTYTINCDDILEGSIIPLKVKLSDITKKFDIYDINNTNKKINNDIKTIYLKKDGATNITYLINYPDPGSYSPPGIWIDGVVYPFGDKIEVSSKLEHSLNGIAIVLTIFSIIMGQIFAVDIRRIAKNRIHNNLMWRLFALVVFAVIVIIIYSMIVWIFS